MEDNLQQMGCGPLGPGEIDEEGRNSLMELDDSLPGVTHLDSEQKAHLEAAAQKARSCNRPGPAKKSETSAQVEGMITSARGLIEHFLESSWVLKGNRCDLERAMSLLDSANHELRTARLAKEGNRRHAIAIIQHDPLTGLMEGEDSSPANQPGLDQQNWLLQTFTTTDPQAAEGNEAAESSVQPGSVTNSATEARNRCNTRRMRSFEDLDQYVSEAVQDPTIDKMLKRFRSLDFDALAFTQLTQMPGRPLQVLGAYCMDQSRLTRLLTEQGQVDDRSKFTERALHFLGAIDKLYSRDVPYHSVAHAADVMMTMEWFLSSEYLHRKVSSLDHLMVMMACAIHDAGHFGLNNFFLIKSMAPQAITYNDKSVLENMHLAKSFEVMQTDNDCNWFEMLSRAYQREDDEKPVDLKHYTRRGLIDMVLATDMAQHRDHVENLRIMCEERAKRLAPVEKKSQAQKQEALNRKLFLLKMTLHAADISNPCKPEPTMLRWTDLLLEEHWAQGDKERELCMDVSPLCDRETGRQTVPGGQIGFMDYVVEPLFSQLTQFMPEAKTATNQLQQNRRFWKDMELNKAGYDEIFARLRSDSEEPDEHEAAHQEA